MSGRYELNQRVWIYRNYRDQGAEPDEGRVVKLGRTLVTVVSGRTGQRNEQFRMDTGKLNDKQYGTGTWIATDEERQASIRRATALNALRSAGVDLRPRASRNIPTAKLEQIVEVLTNG